MALGRILEPPRNLDPQLRLRSSVSDHGARLSVLERQLTESPNYIGASGQPSFTNGWMHYDTNSTVPNTTHVNYRNAFFYKDRNRVYLGGVIKSGTLQQAAFTLPVGYRPFQNGGLFAVVTYSEVHGTVVINNNGTVVPYTGSNVYYSLEGISFRV